MYFGNAMQQKAQHLAGGRVDSIDLPTGDGDWAHALAAGFAVAVNVAQIQVVTVASRTLQKLECFGAEA